MSTINTNAASINAQRNLSASQGSLSTSMQRLSSGLRVNSAKDDAAGLAISERMNSQVKGMNVAIRNANDGISLAQTAEGALGKVGDMLQRVRELAVQSANATNSDTDRTSLQAEANQLKLEIQRVAEQTKFNGTALLDGSFSAKAFQVGANQGETISIDSIANTQMSALGSWTSVDSTTPAVAGASSSGQFASLNFSTAPQTLVGGTNSSTFVPASADFSTNNASFTVGTTAISLTADYSSDTNADAVVSAINLQLAADSSSITATNTGNGITFTDSANATAVAISSSNAEATAAGFGNSAGTAGTPASAGSAVTFAVDGTSVTLNQDYSGAGGQATMVGAIQSALGANYVVAASGNAGFTVTSATPGAATAATLSFTSVAGTSTTNSGFSATQTATAADAIFVAGSAQTGFADLNIDSVEGANNAILAMDAALTAVNNSRGDLGAMQSRFENAIGTLQVTSENLASARGRIVDADFAKETSNLSRAQILQQAGTAMVAQANQLPQGVLSLLR